MWVKKNGDNPPCQKAKNRYIDHLPNQDEDYFKCTEEDDVQKPVVFEIRANGIWYDDGREEKKNENKSSTIGQREHLYG